MSVDYASAVKTARMQAVADSLDDGSTLVVGTSALSGATGVLATIPLASPTPAGVSGSVMSLNGLPLSAAAVAAGTAALAELRDSLGAVVVSGLTVGLAGTDIIINATAVSIGQTITCDAGAITHG